MQTTPKRFAKEGHAYSPGLKVKRAVTIRKVRRLPIVGQILVKIGDEVKFDTIVAKTEILGQPCLIDAANELGLTPQEVPKCMLKETTSEVKNEEIIAQWIGFMGLVKKYVRSPVDGIIEDISTVTGRITIRGPPIPIEKKAYLPGKVIEIIPNEGVVVQTNAAIVQGIFGIGGERHGQLKMLVKSPDEILKPNAISNRDEGKIIVGGSFAPLDTLQTAVENKIAGIIVGAINASDLNKFLGYQMGVAITGEETVGITLIVTEGFGEISMATKTFNLLKSFNDVHAVINGETQIRAGVIRPELIIPSSAPGTEILEEGIEDMSPGTPIRIIREPYFGILGTVDSLPVELQRLESESEVRVVNVRTKDGHRVTVPRANVEIIDL